MPTRQTTSLPCTQFTVGAGNWNEDRGPVHTIVLHTMVGSVVGADARFNTPNVQVSAHYGVGLDGKLYQWVDEDNVAFHAGNYLINQTSIGIEHADDGDYNGVRPDVLYEASARLVADICKFYEFPADTDHIFKHKNVADNPTTCPDALDTDRIIAMAAAILNPITEPIPPTAPVVETPAPEVVSVQPEQPTQTDANPVQNTPEQTVTTPSEAVIPPGGQAGKVPFLVETTDVPTEQAKLDLVIWIKSLIIQFLKVIGIEEVKS